MCIHSAAKRFPASARELKGLNFVDSQIPGWMKVEDAEPVAVQKVEEVPMLGLLPLGLETPIVETADTEPLPANEPKEPLNHSNLITVEPEVPEEPLNRSTCARA